ncbi:glycosyltransferase [Stigmatella sp. ncwal1]|uniref:Glycosyltransferase n=1 Tax=Stigmatella ashevillensis TaxID=2995309 RepID=A0ABT5DCV8_9BACT|nr:glycosyltransferase [Stigmatella ashevillena]MDC0711520.1 glycosyltransferase [Stigmatella ashevillena]
MNLVLVPEPAPWLGQLPTLMGNGEQAEVLAPWALPAAPTRWGLFPSRLRGAWRRRTLPAPEGFRVWGLPGWWAVEAGLRLGARSAAASFRARFALRRRVAQATAALLPEGVETVVAPSLCARELFAAARRQGARCVLIEDLPFLRALHADLDEAAFRHPEESFLRNHRASAEDVARQEAERVLADECWVRSAFSRERLLRDGHASERIRDLHLPAVAVSRGEAAQKEAEASPVALLAGPALARGGLREALAALEARPGWHLWVRPTEGTDVAVLKHPRVQRVTEQVQRTLRGVDVVLAPSWCESHPSEVATAMAWGIPVIATDRASGFHECHTVPRGNVAALVMELDAVRAT